MPTKTIKAMARKHGVPVKAAEALWEVAKAAAAREGHKEDWEYVMGIFNKLLFEHAEKQRRRR